jgi:N-acetylglucosaminyldiphosphoundecaprenol N-acetyl-beta-D-mannosaminyltransferase
MTKLHGNSIMILGTKLSLFDQAEIFKIIHETIKKKRKILITSGNIHAYNYAYRFQWFQEFFNSADIVRLDGAGVRLGAKILGYETPKRMTWADFGWDLANFSQQKGFSLFLLGTKHAILGKAKEKLLAKFPYLKIVGSHHGYFKKDTNHPESMAVIEAIQKANPDILLVGFGMPLQEKWIKENYEKIGAHVIFTVGAAFDYISGELERAPKWMTNNGLEWLGRMIIEPGRLWKRYLIGNPLFLFRVFLQKIGLLNLFSNNC